MPQEVMPARDMSRIMSDPAAFGLVLLTGFLDMYGTEGTTWQPPTIQMEIEQDLGIDMPPANYDRLLTAISILTTNSFYVSLPDFVRNCVVLSGHLPAPDLLMLPDASDIAWGVTEGILIYPPDKEEQNPFVAEITAFIGKVLDSEGILNPPDILRIATHDQSLLNRVNYDYSDDTELFSSMVQMENDKTNDINHIIKGRTKAMLLQMQQLPLRNGKTEHFVKKLLEKMPDDEPLPLA